VNVAEYFLGRLADLCTEVSFDTIKPETVHQIKRIFLDYVGCALGAWRIGINRSLVTTLCSLQSIPEATVWGDGSKMWAPHAALAVGTMTSHLEYDTHSDMIPAAVAVAEMRHCDGKAFISSLLVGHKVAAAFKHLLASEIETHGLHWPAQIGVYAAAAAACRLWGMTAGQMAGAMSWAGCLAPVAPFEAFTKGASVKDFYGGWCGMLGVMAAMLADRGFDGPLGLLEGTRGLGRAWLHSPPSDVQVDSAIAAARSEDASQIRFKPFAACTSAQPTLSAIEELQSRHADMKVDDIRIVDIGTYAYAVELSGANGAETAVAARTNIPYLSAAMLVDGMSGPEQTELPRLRDPHVRALAARISVSSLPGTDTALRTRHRPADVRITLSDGRQFQASVSESKWTHLAPPSDSELESKLRGLVGEQLGPDQREKLLDMLWHLESIQDMTQIVNCFH
jgi:2-methylcitrate dehydratase PrpD